VWQIAGVYARDPASVHYLFRRGDRALQDDVANLVVQCESLWYIRARPWVDDADGKILASLNASYVRGETLEFPGVSAIHFTRRP
jgi:hypothetical protein